MEVTIYISNLVSRGKLEAYKRGRVLNKKVGKTRLANLEYIMKYLLCPIM
jgi:hypothetical protein